MERPQVRGPMLGVEAVRGEASRHAEKERILSRSPLARLTSPSRQASLEIGRIERLARRQPLVQQGAPTRRHGAAHRLHSTRVHARDGPCCWTS
ncbi:hypothetical protein WMF18_00165 [Sorangium sp. So ce315]|uniref:hypothetical protein n=1 Tax=Sorangium sp. So ce315 TaxID=3133299 RepID=UPI003F62651C